MEYLEGLKDRCETWGAERDKLKAQLDIAMVALNHYAEPNGLSEEFLARTAITKIKEIK